MSAGVHFYRLREADCRNYLWGDYERVARQGMCYGRSYRLPYVICARCGEEMGPIEAIPLDIPPEELEPDWPEECAEEEFLRIRRRLVFELGLEALQQAPPATSFGRLQLARIAPYCPPISLVSGILPEGFVVTGGLVRAFHDLVDTTLVPVDKVCIVPIDWKPGRDLPEVLLGEPGDYDELGHDVQAAEQLGELYEVVPPSVMRAKRRFEPSCGTCRRPLHYATFSYQDIAPTQQECFKLAIQKDWDVFVFDYRLYLSGSLVDRLRFDDSVTLKKIRIRE